MTRALDCVAPLFVPGHRPDRFAKAAASGADAVIIDLEDAVPADAKEAARANIRADLDAPVIVRVNGPGTPWWDGDLAAVASLPLAGIMVPKAATGVPEALSGRGITVPVLALIETARGLADARRLAATPPVGRLAFGSVDYCAELGLAHERDPLLAARSEIVLASRLAGLPPPLDGVTTALGDDGAAGADARYARSLGFGGKLCIHPRQTGAVLVGFSPSAEDVAWAEKVLSSGDGAVAVDGSMVDEPVRIRARAILSRAEARSRG